MISEFKEISNPFIFDTASFQTLAYPVLEGRDVLEAVRRFFIISINTKLILFLNSPSPAGVVLRVVPFRSGFAN